MSVPSQPRLPQSAPRPGEFISGKYQVDQALGAGGTGYVLSVTRLADGTQLAIKMLQPELAKDPEIVARFLHEARTASSIQSEHVVRVHDVGTLPTGTPYLVMERLRGVDLAAHLERAGRVPYPQAVDWVLEACEALAEAHAQRFVHRDLKPSNLFLAETDHGIVVKVLDFGIAKSLNAGKGAKLTMTAAVLGSPSYMSPEQLRSSKDVDERTDIWSLGVVLYELMTLQVPFDAPTIPELSMMIFTTRAPTLLSRGLDVPPELSAVVAACLRRDRDIRFSNLAELAAHLGPFASPKGQASAHRVIARLGLPAQRIVMNMEEPVSMPYSASSPRISLKSDEPGAMAATAFVDRGGKKSSGIGIAVGAFVGTLALMAVIGLRFLGPRSATNAGADASRAAAASSVAPLTASVAPSASNGLAAIDASAPKPTPPK